MKKSLLVALILPFLLVGCSSTFAYNNLDWLLYWYLDDYVELDKGQKQQFDVELTQWLRWHRTEELQQYQQQLLDLQQRLAEGPLTADQWYTEFGAAREHWVRLRDKVGPDLVAFAPTLTDRQVDDLFEALEKDNQDEVDERNASDEQERLEDRQKRIEKQLKGYIGKLTKQQKTLIADSIPEFQSNFDNWITYRRTIQADAKQLMLARQTDPEFTTKLMALFTAPEAYQSAQYQAISEHNRRRFCTVDGRH